MKRTFTLIAVFSSQALIAFVALVLYFVTRPSLADLCLDLGSRVPPTMALALSSWFLPSLVTCTIVCDLAALALRKRSARNVAMGLGVVVPAAGVILAAFGLFAPLFQLAPAP